MAVFHKKVSVNFEEPKPIILSKNSRNRCQRFPSKQQVAKNFRSVLVSRFQIYEEVIIHPIIPEDLYSSGTSLMIDFGGKYNTGILLIFRSDASINVDFLVGFSIFCNNRLIRTTNDTHNGGKPYTLKVILLKEINRIAYLVRKNESPSKY